MSDSAPPSSGLREAPRRHLLHVMPTFGVGGIQVRMSRVLNGLGRRYRHTIIALDGVDACRDRLDPALGVEVLTPRIDKGRLLANWREFRATIVAHSPDLLLTYNWGTIEWAMANRLRPVARHIHFEAGFGVEEATTQFRRRILFRRLALGRALRIVVPSRNLERIALDIWRIGRERVAYVPNGIDCARFAVAPDPGALPALQRRPGEFIVGTIAPLRPEKNIGRLLRVFARFDGRSDLRLFIVGDGSERKRLEEEAAALRLGDRVVFAGPTSKADRVLGLFDAFALSSDTEQMPNTVIEAMAAGLPVAAVDVGDVMAMLAPPNRELIVPKENEAAFAAAILRLKDDAALRAALGRANRDHVREQYSQERMFAAYDALFSL